MYNEHSAYCIGNTSSYGHSFNPHFQYNDKEKVEYGVGNSRYNKNI